MTADITNSVKGFCLAAGFATRLKPLSDYMPKAKVPIMGVPSLHYALKRLEAAGLKDVAVNAHHLHEQVRALVDTYPGELNLKYSYEKEILGTGGAFIPLRTWFAESPILLANPDIVTDLDIEAFISAHLASNNLATLAIIEKHPQAKAGTVWYANDERIAHIGKTPQPGKNAGYGIAYFMVSPRIFTYLAQTGFSNLSEAFNAAITAGEILKVFKHPGYFRDLGDSFEDLFGIHVDLMRHDAQLYNALGIQQIAEECGVILRRHGATSVLSSGVSVEDGASVGGHAFVFGSCNIPSGATLGRCLLNEPKAISGSISGKVLINQFSVATASVEES